MNYFAEATFEDLPAMEDDVDFTTQVVEAVHVPASRTLGSAIDLEIRNMDRKELLILDSKVRPLTDEKNLNQISQSITAMLRMANQGENVDQQMLREYIRAWQILKFEAHKINQPIYVEA